MDAALAPIDLASSAAENGDGDDVVTVLDPDESSETREEPDPETKAKEPEGPGSDVESGITGEEEPVRVENPHEVWKEDVRQLRERNDRALDAYAARFSEEMQTPPETGNRTTVPPLDVQAAAVAANFREQDDEIITASQVNVVNNVVNRRVHKLRSQSRGAVRESDARSVSELKRAASTTPAQLRACGASVSTGMSVKDRIREINGRTQEMDELQGIERDLKVMDAEIKAGMLDLAKGCTEIQK